MVKISVVMAVKDGGKFLSRTLESILSQTFSNFEVIIVDDGSRDNTCHIVHTYQNRDLRIKHVMNPGPEGNSNARNYGVSLANGSWIAICDADDIWHREKLEKQVEFLENLLPHVHVSAIGTYGFIVNEDDRVVGTLEARPTNLDEFYLMRNDSEVFMLHHSSVLINKDTFVELGGYSTDYIGAEDTELFTRIAERGVVLNLSEHLFSYRKHLGSFQLSKTQTQVFNMMRIAENYQRRTKGMSELTYNDFVKSFMERLTLIERIGFLTKIRGKYLYRIGAIYSANGHYIRGFLFLLFATFHDWELVFSGVRKFAKARTIKA